jgi:hypothetical protein
MYVPGRLEMCGWGLLNCVCLSLGVGSVEAYKPHTRLYFTPITGAPAPRARADVRLSVRPPRPRRRRIDERQVATHLTHESSRATSRIPLPPRVAARGRGVVGDRHVEPRPKRGSLLSHSVGATRRLRSSLRLSAIQSKSDKNVGFHDATRLATLHNSAMPGPLTDTDTKVRTVYWR